MNNPWFRFYHEFADDPKVQMLSESYQRRFVMLMCFRCKNETLQDCFISFQLRVTETEWQETKAEFMRLGFIDNDNNLLHWDKRQYVSDSSTERVRKHRENKKRPCNVTVTPPDTDTDTDTEQIKKDVTLKNLSVDHVSDWLTKKRVAGIYLTIDEHSLLERFKTYCEASGKKYKSYPVAFQNSFRWDNPPIKKKDNTENLKLQKEAMGYE